VSRFFEDYAVGQRFAHATPRTITPGDTALYIALTGARQPLHCSEPLARAFGHPACPVDDLLAFHVAFGKTVPDISYNAVANLGYADLRFVEPVYPGDTLTADSVVLGLRQNANGRSGIVYVRSRAVNQHGREAVTWARWVMVEKKDLSAPAPATVVPELPRQVEASRLTPPRALVNTAALVAATGSDRLWDDYVPGTRIDHPGGMTLEEAEHMLATRLYQNTARLHFDAQLAKGNAFGRRLVYGGHVMSLCRALGYDGLENAFAIAAVNGGTHANPTFAGDTLYCRHVVLDRWELPGRRDAGALRLRLLGVKNAHPSTLPDLAPGERHEAFVLDLDYTVLLPRRAGTVK
jgi:2-methylfumaryl-CoA hydratase